MRRHRLLFGLTLLCVPTAPAWSAAERLPNFVIVFIDDMGYADIGPFGAKGYQTPALDRMAKEGRVFTDFYVTQAVCSASRAGLMTGCYNVRVSILGALGPKASHGINADEVTLAEIVKQTDSETTLKARGTVDGRTTVGARLILERYNLADRDPGQAATDEHLKHQMREMLDLLRRPGTGNGGA